MVPVVVLCADEEARRLEDQVRLRRVLDVEDVRLLGRVGVRGLELEVAVRDGDPGAAVRAPAADADPLKYVFPDVPTNRSSGRPNLFFNRLPNQ